MNKTYEIVFYLSGIQKEYIRKAYEYIMENYRRPDFDYKELCSAIGLGYAYFSELFKKAFKMSPVKFVTKMRIDYAKELLVTNRRSVSKIAETDRRFFKHLLLFKRVQKANRIFTLAIPC